jgi:iron complex outermembrane receptor protein
MLEDKERVEVLKGASALYYGFTTPSGIVNYVTKRPTQEDLSSLSFSFDQYGTQIAAIDLSRRFGEDREHGLRLNAGGGALGSYLEGASDGNRRFAALAYDWKVSSRLRLSADLEYDHRKTTEQVGVALPPAVDGVITLPKPVDPKKMVGWSDSRFETDALNALVRADYALDDNWVWTAEAGKARTERDRNLATFTFTNASTVATGAGRVRVNSQHSNVESEVLKTELSGRLDLLGMAHELTLGVSRTDKSQDPIYATTSAFVSQNLYDPVAITSLTWGATPTSPTTEGLRTRDTGVYALDRVQLNSQWQLIGGLRNSSYQSDQGTAHYDVSRTTPMVAAIWRPADHWSVYASYAQGVEEGDAAPNGTTNVGERMAPGVSKQYELGARWQTEAGSLLSAAVFEIDRPGAYTNTSNTYVSDGEIVYRGVELSTQGQLTRSLGWLTSAQWLDPRFVKTSAAYVDKVPENAARRTASAFLSWDTPWVRNLTLNSGAYYTGERPVNDLNQAWLPSYTIYTAGARYMARIAERKVTWQLNVENLLDEQYWAAGGTRLASGAPRTVKLGVKIDL